MAKKNELGPTISETRKVYGALLLKLRSSALLIPEGV